MSRTSAQDAGTARANQLAVFLSYGRADDEQFVAALQRQLAGRGIGVWRDRAEMPSRGLTFLQEIRDAVAVAERLVLVVGPAALRSDYVRAEWQYALALSKPVIPVLRIGEMEALPPEVGRVHCIDARATRPAQDAFDELARVLGEPLPPLGAFLTPIPALPPYFQPRTAEMSRLAELLLEDENRPVTVTGPQRVLVLHGLPGMGKSVTAAAFARSTETRRSFADGVLWLSGQQVTAADVARALGADGTANDDARAMLVVIDDASGLAEVEPILNQLGARGRVLVTTRNAGLARSLGAREVFLDALAPDATLRQLADSAGSSVEALPTTAQEVAKWCAGLPFASAVCGAMVRGGRPWNDLLDALREADLAYLADATPNYPHASVLACLAVAVEGLPEAEAAALADLRVYPRGVPIPDALVLRFWASHRQLGARAARDTLARLADRALLRWDGEPRMVQLHALEHDLLRARGPDAAPLHRAIVDMYRRDCPTDWAAGPRTTATFSSGSSITSLPAATQPAATRLLFDPGWMQAKLRAVGLHAVIADYGQGLGDDPEAEREVREALLHAAPAILSAPDHVSALLADRLPDPVRPSTAELAGRLRSAVPRPRFRLLGRTLAGRAEGLIVTVPDVGRELRAVAMLPGNERFATASEDGVLRIHELGTGRLTDEVYASGALLGACALPDGRDVAMIARRAGDHLAVLEVYDVQEQVLRPLSQSEGAAFSAVCALADGTLVTGDDDGVLTHWDRAYAVPLRRWRAPDDHSSHWSECPIGRSRPCSPCREATALRRWPRVTGCRSGTCRRRTRLVRGGRRAEGDRVGGRVPPRCHAEWARHVPRSRHGRRRAGSGGRAAGGTTGFALHAPSMTAVWATDIHTWRFFFGRAELYSASLAGERSSLSSAGRTTSRSRRWRSMRRARCSSPGQCTARCASGTSSRRRRAAMRHPIAIASLRSSSSTASASS